MTDKNYLELISLVRKAGILGGINELLSWDQEVMMPKGANTVRSMEMGVIAEVSHDIGTQDKIGLLISQINETKLSTKEIVTLREIKEDYERAKKVPSSLVKEAAELYANAMEVWRKARETNTYSLFAPWLEKIIDINKRYAQAINPNEDSYAILFYDYEKGLTLDEVRAFFKTLKAELVPLIHKIGTQAKVDTKILSKKIPVETQMKFNHYLAELIGYDFSKGRLDVSTHPFTAGYGRITTRFDEGWLPSILSTLHESGHGMYEHNLPISDYGLPAGTARSLGVHESQSRFFENHIGRSKQFWKTLFPKLQKEYGLDVSFEVFYRLINIVEPGFIRVNADELTYSMHVILRFEIEQDLLHGVLSVNDLPKAWNAKMKEYLGVVPPTDSLGCLQDMHWASGGVGYFATYAIGSMISAQLFAAAKRAIPKLEQQIEKHNFKELHAFLKTNIHSKGCLYSTKELILKATGKEPGPDDYVSYLKQKFEELYSL